MPNTLSYWERNSFLKDIDVAVIGSGLIGLTAAIRLKELDKSLRVIVIERGVLPEGASTRNAGFACFGSLTELIEDLKTHSEEEVFGLVDRRWRGLLKLRARVGDKKLGYEGYGGYEVFQSGEGNVLEECKDQMPYFNDRIGSIVGLKDVYRVVGNDFGFKGILGELIHNNAEGQLDTGAMMVYLLGLAEKRGVRVLNGWNVTEMEDIGKGVRLVSSEGWDVLVGKVLVATNGFARQLLPELDVVPARNQVLITKPIRGLALRGAFHYDKGYYYFRNVGNRMLLGGGRNLDPVGEETDAFGHTVLVQDALKRLMGEVILPSRTVALDGWWSGILGLGAQKKPIVKMISDNVVVAVRMGGMGIAIGSLVGEEGASLIVNSE